MDNSFPHYYINPGMGESLYYLFFSGLILGSGPCLGFCAPVLAGFVAAYKPSWRQALIAYLIFSLTKILSYAFLGALCGAFSGVLKSSLLIGYLNIANLVLGFFVLLIGIITLIFKQPLNNKYCAFLTHGNLSNVGILGLLAGFSPCLPLLAILNYIIIISGSALEGAFYALIFGLATSISPVILMVGLSARLAGGLAANIKLKILIRIISGLILVYLGSVIIWQRLIC